MKVKKKPVVVNAWRLDSKKLRDRQSTIPSWVVDKLGVGSGVYFDYSNYRWYIYTLEGLMSAHDGDYLIQGIQGELYPCREDIFGETYEVLEFD